MPNSVCLAALRSFISVSISGVLIGFLSSEYHVDLYGFLSYVALSAKWLPQRVALSVVEHHAPSADSNHVRLAAACGPVAFSAMDIEDQKIEKSE